MDLERSIATQLQRLNFTNAGALPPSAQAFEAPPASGPSQPGLKRLLTELEEGGSARGPKRPAVGYLQGLPVPALPLPPPPAFAPAGCDRWGLRTYSGRGHDEEDDGWGAGGGPPVGAKMARLPTAHGEYGGGGGGGGCVSVGGGGGGGGSAPPPPPPPPPDAEGMGDAPAAEPDEVAAPVPEGLLRLYRGEPLIKQPQPHHLRHLALIPYTPPLFGGGKGGGADEPTAAAALAGLGSAPTPPHKLLEGSMGS